MTAVARGGPVVALVSVDISPTDPAMRARTFTPLIGLLALLGACSRTDNGDLVVKRPSNVDVKTTEDTIHLPSVTTRTDTINTPVVGTQKETLIVNKPVIGTKKSVVKVPVIQKP
ncbi:MAG: hypothetical protein ACREPM_15010 [Gemmatimonadaceae bacterium]